MSILPLRIKTVIDTNVLYSRVLRDIFLYADSYNLIKVYWSEQTIEELSKTLQSNLPAFDRDSAARLFTAMNHHFPDALIKRDLTLEHDIISLGLPDIEDAHVVSAAIASESSLLCTWNLSDFPEEILTSYNIQPISPDSLILNLISNYPKEFE